MLNSHYALEMLAPEIQSLVPGLLALTTPVCLIATDERVVMVNQAYLDLIDRQAHEVVGKRVRDFVSASGYELAKPYLTQAARHGSPVNFTRVWKNRAGVQKWIGVAYVPFRGADGTLLVILTQITQIQDVQRLEEAFVERERMLSHITDDTARPILYVDRDLVLRFMNKPFQNWIGNQDPDLIGKHISTVVAKNAYDFYVPFVHRCLRGEPQKVESLSLALVGDQRHVRMEFLPDLQPDGSTIGVYLIGYDIEEDYRLRKNLMIKESEIRSVMDSVDMPLSKSDHELRYLYVNRVACEWLARSEDQIVGKGWNEVLGEREFAEIQPFATRALAGEVVSFERLLSFPGHPAGHVRINIFPDRAPSGVVLGVYVVITDVERDYRHRQEIVDREEQLRLFTDNIPESIAYIDAERRYKFVNKAFLAKRGKLVDEVIGRTTEEVLGHEAAELAAPFVKRAFNGETVVYERLVQTVDSGPRWHRIRTVPDVGPGGRVRGLYVVGTDVHDIRTAHEILEGSEGELRSAMDSVPCPLAFIDRSYRYRLVNRQLETLVGKKRDELIGNHLLTVFSQKRFDEVKPLYDRVLSGETVSTERLITSSVGEERWMTIRYTPRYGADGQVVGIYSAATDIDELKRTEIELRRVNWMLTSHFENSPLAVIEWDHEFKVRRWSPQAEKIFGWSENEVLGKHFRDWRFVVEDDDPQFSAVNMRLLDEDHPRTTSLNRNYRNDGRIIWCEWYNSSLRDDSGNVVSILSLTQDVTTRVLAEERLIYQATHDGLTSLPNRAMLQDRMQQAISRARRNGVRVAALFIDLDRFKEVNDTLGHRIGDELLREIAERLKRTLRESDFLVRLSGDEFMVVLEQVADLDPAGLVAAKILEEIQQPTRIEGHEIHISASIGISLFPDDADDVESLLKNSDMAMYRAKALGKNAYRFFSVELAEQGAATRLLENSLRSALLRNEFELYYQPKIDMRTGNIVGAEALLRWHHPTRGIVLPGEFVRLAEESALMPEIGNWVLDVAFAQLRRWRDKGFGDMRLAINLATGQFRATNLLDRIKDRLERERCIPDSIEIEITETSMMGDPDGVGGVLRALRELGLRVAIDDFGTGYSSLSHLKRFPIDTLKIDKTFIADILHDRQAAAIVSAVIAMARALDLDVIAEGVETEAQRLLLAEQGCDAYQGFLFSPALPIGEFDALLQRHRLAYRMQAG